MKKLFLMLGVACGLSFGGIQTAKAADVAETLVMYLPNRVIDLFDIFTLNLGVGPVVEAQLMGTRAINGGGGVGMSYKMYKTHHRQYGFGKEEGWYWSLVSIGGENFGVIEGTPLIKKYTEHRDGFPSPDMRVYNFFNGARDYWAIGGTLGAGITGDLYIHPVEWFDLASGFFFIDISGDDLTFADFQ